MEKQALAGEDIAPVTVYSSPHTPLRVGFASTRFSGTDGVSLETGKMATVLERMGHECFYFAGDSDRPAERSFIVPEACFTHPAIRAITDVAFSGPWGMPDLVETVNPKLDKPRHNGFALTIRPPALTKRIQELKDYLKEQVYAFVNQFDIQLLIVQNALAIPMNIPLGLALTEFIAETGYPTIGHHHDFFWERKRFLQNCVGDYLSMAFPPPLPSIQHVAISSWAASQMSLRTGISPLVVPNVMDFDTPPPPPDDYVRDLRANLGLEPSEYFILQPTRVVQRKGIEHAIELVKRLGFDARLVISHASGDEGDAYEMRVRDFADLLGVKTRFVANIIRPERGQTEDGRKVYSLWDVYPQADLVTYPSTSEGFGNAFLEAIYFHRPIVVNNYSTYSIDIKPKGFRVIEFDGFISNETVEMARRVLEDRELAQEMAEHNYRLGKRFFSYTVLAHRLRILIANCFGEEL